MPKKTQIKKKRVVFALDAAGAKEVSLVGTFNLWDANKHSMKREKDGVWKKIIVIPPGTYEYKFLVDGEWWNDPKNQNQCQNEHGTLNSVITVG